MTIDQDAVTVVFRSQSDIEANVVRGLLQAHGFHAQVASNATRTLFPVTIQSLGEVRVSVRAEEATAATRVIEEYREEVSTRVGQVHTEFRALETRLGYRFRDQGLLEHALTHRSRAHEDASGGVVDNESLEFLGDAVLGFIIADRLFREFPDRDEGWKSKARARLVSAPALATLGEALGLGRYLLLGHGEEKTGGRRKPSLIADSFEAVVAAIYLDGGLPAADAFVESTFRPGLKAIRSTPSQSPGATDFKSSLQEWVQGHDQALPEYRLTGERGPDHRKVFEVEVVVGNESVGHAEGKTKKEAEQRAAERALLTLTQHGSADGPAEPNRSR